MSVDRSLLDEAPPGASGAAPEQMYHAIFEHPTELAVVLVAERDASGKVVDWRYRDANSNALKLLGRSREAVLGRRIGEIMGEAAAAAAEKCQRVLEQRSPLQYEAAAAGRTFRICLFPIGIDMVVSSAVDVTQDAEALRDIRRSSESTRAEKEWLSAVLNAMTEEVYFTDTQRRYTYANPAAMREFGHERVDGLRVEDVVAGLEVLRPDGTPRPQDDAPPLRALRGEIIKEEEQVVRTPRTGELRHRQVNAAPVRNAAGEIIGSVAVVRDITERKRFEQTLEADLRDTSLLRNLAVRVVNEGDPRS
ncbi:MAG TPA: PAS domain-containing protein, partial [Steroidobacteraceae bacterium]